MQSDPNDGKWHMVTLSTQPYSFAGYRLFLDGECVGELSGNSTAANGEGPVQVLVYPSNPSHSIHSTRSCCS